VLHDFIKTVLFNPWVVCWALIVGGFAILAAEKWAPPGRVKSVEALGWKKALQIGAAQCLAMIPGVSRSAATILGALLLGVDRKTATEFSFYLAIPTLMGASVFDLWKAREEMTVDGMGLIAVGLVTSFVVAVPVVKWFVGYVSRHGFAPFAWYRVGLGVVGLVLLGMNF
jgi:undecaprenyl-diphosphatase